MTKKEVGGGKFWTTELTNDSATIRFYPTTENFLLVNLTRENKVRGVIKFENSKHEVVNERFGSVSKLEKIWKAYMEESYRELVDWDIVGVFNELELPIKEEETPKVAELSFYEFDNSIAEQVYDPENRASVFLVCGRDGKIVTAESLVADGKTIYPIRADEILFGAVKLPSRAEDYGTLKELLERIEAHIGAYLDVSPFFVKLASYYILTTWLFDNLYAVPYLRALGDTGCGKTRFLDVLGGLCYKPISVSGCITPAPVYRLIRKWGGTIILDESDFKDSSEQAEIIKILNCGIERGKPIIRCDSNNPEALNVFPSYCPKLFATRKTFYDKALESRCITEVMAETVRKDIPDQLPKRFHVEQLELRNKLLMFRFRHYWKVDPETTQNIDLSFIEPRLRQVSRSLLAFMAERPEIQRGYLDFLRAYNQELIEERSESFEGQVVGYLVEHEGKEISAGDVAEWMNDTLKPRKQYTAQRIGKTLKALKVMTYNQRLDDGTRKRIIKWDVAHMKILKARYCTNGTFGTLYMGVVEKTKKEENIPWNKSALSPHTNVPNVPNVTDSDYKNKPQPTATMEDIMKKIQEYCKTERTVSQVLEKVKQTVLNLRYSRAEPRGIIDVMLKEGWIFRPKPGTLRAVGGCS